MTQSNENHIPFQAGNGLAQIEDRNALLERTLIANFLSPYQARWKSMTPIERERLRIQASTHASCELATAHSCRGLLLGFVALLNAASGGLH